MVSFVRDFLFETAVFQHNVHVQTPEGPLQQGESILHKRNELVTWPTNLRLCVDRGLLSQHQADEVQGFDRRIECLIGPPGTGKSHIIAVYVKCWPARANDEFISIMAPTNKAAEQLCKHLETQEVPFLTTPSVSESRGATSINNTLFAKLRPDGAENHNADARASDRHLETIYDPTAEFPWAMALQIIAEVQQKGVFVSTVHTTKTPNEHLERAAEAWAAIGPVAKMADFLKSQPQMADFLTKLSSAQCKLLIEDEAGNVRAEATAAELLHMWPQYVLMVGDPYQLPPYTDLDGKPSLMEKLLREEGRPKRTLGEVWRMGPILTGLLNVFGVYERQLRSVAKAPRLDLIQIHNVRGSEETHNSSICNRAEMNCVIELVVRLRREFPQDSIKVITFYSAQRTLLQDRLAEKHLSAFVVVPLSVGTVDSSQGSEGDISILSTVRTGVRNHTNPLGFVNHKNRVLVGVSRARHQLHIVGDVKSLEKYSPRVWAPVLRYASGEQPNCPRQRTFGNFLPEMSR
jgi:hypothetical protein